MMTKRMNDATLEEFRTQIRGEVLSPGDDGYDGARAVWNGMIDRRPALIVRCTGAADVIEAIDFARDQDLLLSVRGGGHGVAGKAVCDGGLMIDLSRMNSVRVDPGSRTAHVGAGARLGDLDHETQAFGLATTSGIDSRTGVAGLTLGGGTGLLARRYGLSIDNLAAADVVTAEGKLVRASEEENPDLFWGLRGGGGNFGVVTSFEFRLHEVGPEVFSAQIFFPLEDAREVLRAYREITAAAPDTFSLYAIFIKTPPVAPFPEALHGKTALVLLACHTGSTEEGEQLLAPLNGVGTPFLEVVQPIPYTTLQRSFDAAAPEGARYYWKTQYLAGLPDEAIETILERVSTHPGAFTSISIEPGGGAVSRVDSTATAFPHRDAAYNFGIWPGWADPAEDEEIIGWARGFHESMTPYSTGGVYVNYMDEDAIDRVAAAYGDNYERLLQLKRKWDPKNLFRMNQNIDPKM